MVIHCRTLIGLEPNRKPGSPSKKQAFKRLLLPYGGGPANLDSIHFWRERHMKRWLLPAYLLMQVSAGLIAGLDPSTHFTEPRIVEETYCITTSDEDCPVSGVMYSPLSHQGPSPLALIAHGNGFEYHEYRYLAEHLAHNGFVVVSISSQLDSEISDRVSDILQHLRFLYEDREDDLSQDLVLIGHSRGGEAVIRTANRLTQHFPDISLRALIAMAPSINDGVEALSASSTQSFLLLYGSHDDDIVGTVDEGKPCDSPFRFFDHAFKDAFWPGRPGPGFSKTMAYVLGASHSGFSDRETTDADPEVGIESYLAPSLQRAETKRLILALLRWQVYAEDAFAPFLIDASRDGNIVLQYEESNRLMLEDFEFSEIGRPKLKESWRHSGGIRLIWDQLYNLEAHSPHDSGGLLVKWDEKVWSDTKLTFVLPEEHRNWQEYPFFSFRAAQVYGDTNNQSECTLDWEIVLEGKHLSKTVRVADFADLTYPETTLSSAIAGVKISKSAMQTVRIPLKAFGQVDWRHVTALTFRFSQPREDGFRRGSLVLDNLALTF